MTNQSKLNQPIIVGRHHPHLQSLDHLEVEMVRFLFLVISITSVPTSSGSSPGGSNSPMFSPLDETNPELIVVKASSITL